MAYSSEGAAGGWSEGRLTMKRITSKLSDFITNYPTLAHLTDEQRSYIGRAIVGVEETTPEHLSAFCFCTSQSIALWDYENGDARIRYIEGCLMTTDKEPQIGNDASRDGRYHHGYNSIDGVLFDIVIAFHDKEVPAFHGAGRSTRTENMKNFIGHERGVEVPCEELVEAGHSYFSDEYAYTVFGTDEEVDVETMGATV